MNDLTTKIECPNCKGKVQIKVKEMIPGRTKNCPFCGTQFNFTGDDGRKIQRELDNLNRTLKRLGR